MVPVTHQWEVSESIGDAGEFHARVPEARRAAVFHSVSTPTLVLGSSQPPDSIDRSVAERLGIDVVSRRSGGGAVLLMPGEFLWLDLVVPAGDPLWSDDVARSMHWVGDLWQRALARVGMVTEVHTGAMRSTEWSSRICFHGLGPGEYREAGYYHRWLHGTVRLLLEKGVISVAGLATALEARTELNGGSL